MKKIIFLLFLSFFCENIWAQAPINDDCAGAIEVKVNLTPKKLDSIIVDHKGATEENFTERCYQGREIWYKFTAPTENIFLQIPDLGSFANLAIFFYEGSCGSLKKVNDCRSYHNQDNVVEGLTVGKIYYISIAEKFYDEYNYTIALYAINGQNQTCAKAKSLIMNPLGVKKDSAIGSSFNAIKSVDICNSSFLGLWYEFTATHTAHVVDFKELKKVNKVTFHSAFFLRDSCNTSNCEFIEDKKTLHNLTIGKKYKIMVGSQGFSNANLIYFDFSLSVSEPPTPPNNDNCINAQVLTYVTSPNDFTKGTFIGATTDSIGTLKTLNVWYKVTLEENEDLTAIHIKDLKQIKEIPWVTYQSRVYRGSSCKNLIQIGGNLGDGCTNVADVLPKGSIIYIEFFGDDQTNFNIGVSKKHALVANQSCDKALIINTNQVCQSPTSANFKYTDALDGSQNLWYRFKGTGKKQVIKFYDFDGDGKYPANCEMKIFHKNCTTLLSEQTVQSSTNEFIIDTDSSDYFIQLRYLSCFNNFNFKFCIFDVSSALANDNFVDAITLPVSPTLKPIAKTAGSTKYATYESVRMVQSCSGSGERDVWYKFKALQATHLLRVGKLQATGVNPIRFAAYVYSDTLKETILCQATILQDSTLIINGLEIGKSYYLVFGYTDSSFNKPSEGYSFEISLATPPTPANDLKINAITLKEGKDWDCNQKIAGATRWATHDYIQATADVWYRFKATSKVYQIKLENIVYVNQNPLTAPQIEVIDSLTGKSIKGNGNLMWACEIGKIYWIKVSTEGIFNQVYFEICLTKPIENNQNRFCENATQLTVNQGLEAQLSKEGVTPIAIKDFDLEESDYIIDTLDRNSAWFKFTATSTRHSVQVFDTELLSNGNNIAGYYKVFGSKSNDCKDFNFLADDYVNNIKTFSTEVGKTYYVLVKGQLRFRFRIAILTPSLMPNDACSKAINMTVNTTEKAISSYALNFKHEAEGKEFWYSFVALNQLHYIKLFNTNTLPPITIYEGDDCGNLTPVYKIAGLWYYDIKLPDLIVGKRYYLKFDRESDFNLNYYPFAITTLGQTPVYDKCENALEIVPSDDIKCSYTTLYFKNATRSTRKGTTIYEDCGNNYAEDIWVKFTAKSTSHTFDFEGETPFVSLHENCDSSRAIACNIYGQFKSLTIGKTYLIRLANSVANNDDVTIKFCITTPSSPINDEIEQAIELSINPNLTCSLTQKGNLANATISSVTTDCGGRAELWYKFKPTTNRVRISIKHDDPKETQLLYYSVLRAVDFNNKEFKAVECTRDSSNNEFDVVGLTPNEEYYVQVFPNWETILPLEFTLCVSQPPIPPVPSNDLCNNAILLTPNDKPWACADNFQYTVKGSTKQDDGSGTCNQTFDVWFKYVAESTEYHLFYKYPKVIIAGYITQYDGDCNVFKVGHCSSTQEPFETFKDLEIGKTYYFKIAFSKEIDFGLCLSKIDATVSNDECGGAKSLIVNTNMLATAYESVNYKNATLSNLNTPIACSGAGSTPDVWYKFVATQNTHWILTFDKTTSWVTNYIELYESPCNSSPALPSCKENLGRFDGLVAGRTYYIRAASSYTENYYYKLAVLTPDNLDRSSCAKAIEVPVTFSPNVQKVEIQTTFMNKTDSFYNPCTASWGKNVMRTWVKFKANHHRILAYFNHKKVNADYVIFGFYSGDCNNLKPIGCQYANTTIFENLKKDSTYYLFLETTEKDFAVFDIILQADTITRNNECSRAKTMLVNNNITPTLKYNYIFKPSNPIDSTIFWFKFKATSDKHILSFSNLKIKNYIPIQDRIRFTFMEKCDGTDIYNHHFMSDSLLLISELTAGNEYYFNINTLAPNEWNVDLALLTPTGGATNINCQTAETISASKSITCINKTKAIFDLVSNKDKNFSCLHGNQKLTYKFVAQAKNHTISVKPKWAGKNHSELVLIQYSEIDDTCKLLNSACKIIPTNPFLNQDFDAILDNLTVGKTYLLELAIEDGNNASELEFCLKSSSSNIANDDCENAITLTPSPTQTPTQVLKGNVFGATTEPHLQLFATGDIWYKFTATNTTHALQLNGCEENLYLTLQDGGCQGASLSYCSGASAILFNNLTIGKEYSIQIYQNFKQNCEFEIALVTPPVTLPNDEYSNAKSLIVNDNEQPTQIESGTTIWATQYNVLSDCHYFNGDVWYSFVAKAKSHRIMLFPTAGQSSSQRIYVNFEQDTVQNSFDNFVFVNATDTTSIYGQMNNLDIGRKYYFYVQNSTHGASATIGTDFKIAITTPSLPTNYTCANAVTLPVNDATGTQQFYHHNNRNNFPQETSADQAKVKTWFKFTPKNNLHYLTVRNWKGNKKIPAYFTYTLYENCNDKNNPLHVLKYPSIGDSILPKLTFGKEYYIEIIHNLSLVEPAYINFLDNNLNVEYDIAITTNPARPSNDEEKNAQNINVNPSPKCNTSTSGSMLYATSSDPQSINDLWYKFTATSNYHIVSLNNIKALIGDVIDIRFECYAQQISPIDNYNSVVYYCEIGKEYTIKVYSTYKGSFSRCSFDICVTSLLQEDNFQGAIAAFANAFAAQNPSFKSAACGITAVGNSLGATYSTEVGVPTGTCGQGTLPRDIWFKHIVEDANKNIIFTFVKTPQGADAQALAYRVVNGKLQVINSTSCPVDTLQNLSVGDTIYFRVWDASDTYFGNYEVCIQSLQKKVATKNIICGTVKIRPNPVENILKIDLEHIPEQDLNILIYNYLGQVVQQRSIKVAELHLEFDVSDLPAGTYIIAISDGIQLQSRKFLKM